ncbi:hypothetical protein M1373_01485 [Candidatus Marsarchaeota archaeon]|nr:hypothetical protein [Candidatus Marsarchaeota archaeon]MCL5404970.1 hypothetical protein [Candidatus Marsarchaeota archaeon]
MMLLIPILLQISAFHGVYSSLFPLIAIAIVLDGAIVGAWYMAGAILGNARVKSSAMTEFYQLIGTAVLVVLLVSVLVIFGDAFYSVTSSTALMNPANVLSLCNGINESSQLSVLNASKSLTGSSLLFSKNPTGFPGLCNIVAKQNTFTEKADYPLAASGVVIANLTNQTALNLNSYFIFDAFIGYLEHLSPQINICISPEPPSPISVQCMLPAPTEADLFIHYQNSPYAGLRLVYKSLDSIGVLMTLALESFIAQLTLTSIFLYIWPYLIFGGVILRVLPFTRKIGGLLIAIGIGAILFFPLVFSIEYLYLGHGLGALMGYTPPTSTTPFTYNSNDLGAYYGFGNLFTNSTYYIPNSTGRPYVTNFYVMPSVANATKSTGCWPADGNLLNAEVEDTSYLLIPFTGLATQLLALINHSVPVAPDISGLPQGCTETQALNGYYMLVRTYGVLGISAYFIPIINLIIVLSGIIGISGLMGGDTALAGLSKLV